METDHPIRRWLRTASEPVDGASLALFRILFGLFMFAGVVRFFAYGWIEQLYVEPTFFFTYEGFDWVRPWPGWGMYAHFAVLGVLALLVAVGLYTRVSLALFFAAFTYVELLDKTNYLNHYYLVSLLAFWMMCMPVGSTWSVDAWRGRTTSSSVPRWCVWALRAQIGMVYVFAGIAKIQPDWLLHAEPLTTWFAVRRDMPLMGPLLARPEAAYFASWFGALFDLSFPFWLSSSRARPYAFAVGVTFHVVTGLLFPIGMFPWIMMAAATVFFSPSWPRRLLSRRFPSLSDVTLRAGRPLSMPAATLVVLFLAVQALLPLRKHLHPGPVAWSEAGFRFSWHVMVMEKTGVVWFHVRDVDDGKTWVVHPPSYLSPRQRKMMVASPDMIAQMARRIADDFRARGHEHVEVRAEAYASLNGRPSAPLLADVDLLERDAVSAVLPLER
jgi:hypothetical protein